MKENENEEGFWGKAKNGTGRHLVDGEGFVGPRGGENRNKEQKAARRLDKVSCYVVRYLGSMTLIEQGVNHCVPPLTSLLALRVKHRKLPPDDAVSLSVGLSSSSWAWAWLS